MCYILLYILGKVFFSSIFFLVLKKPSEYWRVITTFFGGEMQTFIAMTWALVGISIVGYSISFFTSLSADKDNQGQGNNYSKYVKTLLIILGVGGVCNAVLASLI